MWLLILFLDNGDEFLMTWEFNSLIQLEKIIGWNIRFDCVICMTCLYEVMFGNWNGTLRMDFIEEKLLYWNIKMMFKLTHNSINQWINWFIGDILAARSLIQARVVTSNTASRCMTPLKLLNLGIVNIIGIYLFIFGIVVWNKWINI